ncbi:hypothetical protein MTO96_046313, partial [Rhipicephalus appendiculatus]
MVALLELENTTEETGTTFVLFVFLNCRVLSTLSPRLSLVLSHYGILMTGTMFFGF